MNRYTPGLPRTEPVCSGYDGQKMIIIPKHLCRGTDWMALSISEKGGERC